MYHDRSECGGILCPRNKCWKTLELNCATCLYSTIVEQDSSDHELPINEALVVGAYCAGVGYTTIKSILNCCEVSFICKETYGRAETKVGLKLQQLAENDMSKYLEETKAHSIEHEKTIQIGNQQHPFTSVIVDGGWAKRSYGHSYNSNAGVAVIISQPLQKVLYMGFRIKTCKLCDENSEKDHHCFKNWEQSAQAMEADIIANGFQDCYDKPGVIFKYLIGDADSSVHAKVQSTVVYPGRIPVEKIDCANHGVRGLNSRIYNILNNTTYSKTDRDTIRAQQQRLGKDTRAAITYNGENVRSTPPTTATTLAEDLINIPRHVFGDHSKCKSYFCKKGGDNCFASLSSSAAGKDLMKGFHLLANRAYKLIADTTSNRAELFMSIMNKMISGKRVNYAQRGGYANRCYAAVLSYNNGSFWPAKVFKKSNEPCAVWKQALREAERDANYAKNKPKKVWNKKPKAVDQIAANFYGNNAHQGSLTNDELMLATSQLVSNLQVDSETRERIQQSTIGQSFNEEWKFQRRDRITASHCGKIYRLSDGTNNACTLKSLLYPTDLSKNENIIRGINMEPRANEVYAYQHGVDVQECGLFVSLENGVLGASPDGLIGTDGLLEVKSVNCMPHDVLKRKTSFLTLDTVSQCLMLKKNHIYYYQVIQQLYVTGRTYCDFMVYFEPEDTTICHFNVERISRSPETDELWSKMKVKLLKFYEMDIAREIVDPTLPKGIPFKQPPYRESAINDKMKKKADMIQKKADKLARKMNAASSV